MVNKVEFKVLQKDKCPNCGESDRDNLTFGTSKSLCEKCDTVWEWGKDNDI